MLGVYLYALHSTYVEPGLEPHDERRSESPLWSILPNQRPNATSKMMMEMPKKCMRSTRGVIHACRVPRPSYVFLLWTHSPMPVRDKAMPAMVSGILVSIARQVVMLGRERNSGYILRLMTFPSTHQSPRTVKRNASVLTMGTVKLSSTLRRQQVVVCESPAARNSPAQHELANRRLESTAVNAKMNSTTTRHSITHQPCQ